MIPKETGTIVVVIIVVFSLPLMVFAQQQEPRGIALCKNLNLTNLSVAYRPYSGTVNLLGIVTNNSTSTIGDIRVIGELYDSNDKLLDVESASIEIGTLLPGDRSAFKIETDVSNQTLDHYNIMCAAID